MRYLLKIFSGPHVGAEVVLAAGETIIGSDPECDLVLEDRLIDERHAALSIENDTITCKPLGEATVLVDGKPVKESVLRPFQYFTIGTTHLAVGPADKPWPHFDLSDFQLRTPDETVPGAEEARKSADEEVDPTNELKTSTPAARPPDSRRWLSKTAIAAAAVVGLNVLLILIAVLIDGSGTAGTDEANQAALQAARKRQFTEQLDRSAPYVVVKNTIGRLQVTGYVSTEAEKDDILQAARELDAQAIVTVRSTESLLESTRNRLKDGGWVRMLAVSAGKPGVVQIKGLLPKDSTIRQRWKATAEQIEKDVPLRELIVEIDASRTTPMTTSPVSVVRSPIPPPDATSPPAIQRTLPMPILDVRVANDKVVTLTDGRQVSIGGRFPDGSRVEEIDLNHAIVRTASGQRFIVPFGS